MKGLLALTALSMSLLPAVASAEMLRSSSNWSPASTFEQQGNHFDGSFFSSSFGSNHWIGNHDEGWGSHFNFFKPSEGRPHKIFGDDPPASTPEPASLSLLLGGLLAVGLVAGRRFRLQA
jgi:hypothetical protein